MIPYVYAGTEEMKVSHRNLVSEGKEIVGLMREGQLVGYVEYHDDGDNELFIDMIFIQAQHQKCGYSTLLLNKLLETYPNTVAFTGESTTKSISFWASKGAVFEPTTFKEFNAKDSDEDSEDEIDFLQNLFPFYVKVQETAYLPFWEAS